MDAKVEDLQVQVNEIVTIVKMDQVQDNEMKVQVNEMKFQVNEIHKLVKMLHNTNTAGGGEAVAGGLFASAPTRLSPLPSRGGVRERVNV
jgi:hypothetical protein